MDYIINRRSVRKFDLTKEISREVLKKLCEYGESAPSARRQESREYIIIDDTRIIEKLSSVSKGTMVLTDCNTVIAVVGKNPIDLSTPDMQTQDLAAATENILIAATSMGLGSCWLGVYPREDRIQAIKEILNMPDEKFPFSLIALGYPLYKDTCFYDAKKLKEENIHFNRY